MKRKPDHYTASLTHLASSFVNRGEGVFAPVFFKRLGLLSLQRLREVVFIHSVLENTHTFTLVVRIERIYNQYR